MKLGQYTLLKENAPNDCQYSCRVLEANLRAATVLAGLMVTSWTAGTTPVIVTVLGWILLIRGIYSSPFRQNRVAGILEALHFTDLYIMLALARVALSGARNPLATTSISERRYAHACLPLSHNHALPQYCVCAQPAARRA